MVKQIMVKQIVVVALLLGSVMSVGIFGTVLFLGQSGCPPALHLSIVNDENYYVQEGLIINITDIDLEEQSNLKTALDNLITSGESFYSQELTIEDQNSIIDFLKEISGDNSFDFVIFYKTKYVSFGIVN